MGTTIHAHIEVKLNGKWEHFAAPSVKRDYRIFVAISSERIDGLSPKHRPVPVSKHHELPEDASAVTRACAEHDRGLGVHGFGYLEAEDIAKLQDELYRVSPEVKRTGIDELDLECSVFHT